MICAAFWCLEGDFASMCGMGRGVFASRCKGDEQARCCTARTLSIEVACWAQRARHELVD